MQQRFLFFAGFFSFFVLRTQAQNAFPYWSLGGNSNASATSKLGTTNNIPLNLITNQTTRLKIYENGRVGIGANITNTNTARVLTLADANAVMRILRVSATNAPALELLSRTSADGANKAYWDMYAEPADASFRIRDRIGSGSGLDRFIINSSGNVGIGTAAPIYKLQVDGASNIGIYGYSSSNYAIYGSSGYLGVYGYGSSYGLFGSGNYGVYGSGTSYGVYGSSYAVTSSGVYGQGTYAFGVTGNSTNNYGGYFASTNLHGIYAKTSSTNPSAYAAVFQGNTYSYGSYLTSDERVKKNISDFNSGMALINQLKPKTYEFISDGKFANLDLPKGNHFGLLAQDVEKIFPALVREAPLEVQDPEKVIEQKAGSIVPDTASLQKRSPQQIETMQVKAINYAELIPMMIKGMQELAAENKGLKKQVSNMYGEIAGLKQLVQDLSLKVNGQNTSVALSNAALRQNQPNPFVDKTIIPLSVPANAKQALLTIAETGSGKVLKTITVAPGVKQISVDAGFLSNGTYTYTLTVDEKKTGSMQMTVIK